MVGAILVIARFTKILDQGKHKVCPYTCIITEMKRLFPL